MNVKVTDIYRYIRKKSFLKFFVSFPKEYILDRDDAVSISY